MLQYHLIFQIFQLFKPLRQSCIKKSVNPMSSLRLTMSHTTYLTPLTADTISCSSFFAKHTLNYLLKHLLPLTFSALPPTNAYINMPKHSKITIVDTTLLDVVSMTSNYVPCSSATWITHAFKVSQQQLVISYTLAPLAPKYFIPAIASTIDQSVTIPCFSHNNSSHIHQLSTYTPSTAPDSSLSRSFGSSVTDDSVSMAHLAALKSNGK